MASSAIRHVETWYGCAFRYYRSRWRHIWLRFRDLMRPCEQRRLAIPDLIYGSNSCSLILMTSSSARAHYKTMTSATYTTHSLTLSLSPDWLKHVTYKSTLGTAVLTQTIHHLTDARVIRRCRHGCTDVPLRHFILDELWRVRRRARGFTSHHASR